MTVPVDSKTGTLPDVFPLLRDHAVGNVTSFALATAVGGIYALVAGVALMRLSGLVGRDRHVRRARDHPQRSARVDEDRPRAQALSLVPETTGMLQATIGALIVDGGRLLLPAHAARPAAARDA